MQLGFKWCLLLSLLFCSYQEFKAQNTESHRHKIGINYGYGTQNVWGNTINSYYDINLFTLEYYYSIYRKRNWNLNLLAFPQYNITSYKFDANQPQINQGYEFGVNFGIQCSYKVLNGKLNPYLLISAGPHYISGAPQNQVPGFIFSDNAALGSQVIMLDALFLDLRVGVRHISNAELRFPNAGVNNLIFSIGLQRQL